MPKLSTIKEIKEQEADTLVMLARGTITNVYPASSGDNAHGPWSLQNIEIKDATGTIKVKLKNLEALAKTSKGKVIEFAATHSDKGWNGVKSIDDEYPTGKFNRVLYVTGACDLSFPTDGPSKPTEPAQQRQREEQPRDPDGPPPADPPPAEHPLAGPRHWLMQWANGYVMSFEAALYVAKQLKERTGVELTQGEIKDIATSASIGFAKEMDISALPAKPLPMKARTQPLGDAYKPEPKPEPRPTQPAKRPPVDPDEASEDDIPF